MNIAPKAAPSKREKPGTRQEKVPTQQTQALDTIYIGRMTLEMILSLLANNNHGSCSTSRAGWLLSRPWIASGTASFLALSNVRSCTLRRRAQASY